MIILKVTEILRARNTFLFKTDCPFCGEELLIGWPIEKCSTCLKSFSNTCLDFDHAYKRNIIAVPDKSRRNKNISKKIVRTLHDIQSGQCAYCDQELTNYHIEHIVPIAGGGTNEIKNLVLACPRCNLKASSLYFHSFIEKKEYILSKIKIS